VSVPCVLATYSLTTPFLCAGKPSSPQVHRFFAARHQFPQQFDEQFAAQGPSRVDLGACAPRPPTDPDVRD
jgi:hypothetical protein